MEKESAIDGGKTLPDSFHIGRDEEQTLGLSLEISDSRNSTEDNPSPVFTQTDPRTLKPHPQNWIIYGRDEDVTELIALIRISRWVKPLVVTPTGTIISGHQRCKAVLALGWESLLVEVREFPDELAELEALLLENASRIKTIEQKVREGEAWKEVEAFKARKRQLAAQNNNAAKAVVENFPQLLHQEKGTTRDLIASRVGIGSGRTYEKAAKVVGVIDEDMKKGNLLTAQGLRKVLNENSVDAAHTLLRKTPEERQAIAELLVKGEAKSIKQAVKIMNQNHKADPNNANSSNSSQPNLAGFSVGDWVEISENANEHNKDYIGQRGQIEQVLAAEQQISVSIESVNDKVRFEPHELSLLMRAAPGNPIQVEDMVFIRIDRQEAASQQQTKWNSYWGKVAQIGEMGSLSVDVGSESFQLFPRDVKLVDSPSSELRQVAERVLRLRRLELDEVEERILDVLQRREWFAPRQLDYLDVMENFFYADLHKSNEHQVIQFRGR